jgi:hypothetical protein
MRSRLTFAAVAVLVMAVVLAMSTAACAAPVVIATIPLVGGGPSTGVAYPVTNRIYVTETTGKRITVIDSNTDAAVLSVPAVGFPGSIALNMATNRLYVCQQSPNALLVLNPTTNTITKSIALPAKPYCSVANPNTGKVYIGYDGTNNVSVVDCATETLLPGWIVTGAGTEDIALNMTNNKIYVARQGSSTAIPA